MQEAFWRGEFGTAYSARNNSIQLYRSNLALLRRAQRHTDYIGSAIEFGANIGLNLKALREIDPEIELAAVEINPTAADELRKIEDVDVYQESLLSYEPVRSFDLSISKGVLIHISPLDLPRAYDVLYRSSRKYILVAEYFSAKPVSIEYRGHKGVLFKRDFAGDMLDLYPDLKLLDYGFCYSRDHMHPQDNINWFMLERVR